MSKPTNPVLKTDQPFQKWIEALPKWQGFHQISKERAYAHAEEDYNAQYGVEETEPEEGQGLCALLETHQIDTSGPALEIGCGTGRLTLGIAQNYPGPDFLITDPSPTFLKITRGQFGSAKELTAQQHFAVLNADDLGLLPANCFSFIALRSTLHHILDVEGFIKACARTLRPNGALVMGAEPCENGYVLMASVGQSIKPTLEAAGVSLSPRWEKQIQSLSDTVKFYCRRDIDKTTAEDKHLFRVPELSDMSAEHGLLLKFLPNATFSDYAPPFVPNFESFSLFFLNYVQYCMQFDKELMGLIRKHMKTHLNFIDDCYRSHVGPVITGVFILKKSPINS